MSLQTAYYSSPIGVLEIKGNTDGIASVCFVDDMNNNYNNVNSSLRECIYQLDEYFNGIRREFGLKLNPEGTVFQKKVWKQLETIPFGKTKSYLQISKQIGDSKATRAVGNANGSNPVSIVIPCHRVIGSSGNLTGYAGGLWRKEWLLNHEKNSIYGRQITLF